MHWATVLNGWTRGEAALAELHDWYNAQVATWSPAQRSGERTAQATKADLERLDDVLREELGLLRVPGGQPEYAESRLAGDDRAYRATPRREPRRSHEGRHRPRHAHRELGWFARPRRRVTSAETLRRRARLQSGKTSKYYAKDMMNASTFSSDSTCSCSSASGDHGGRAVPDSVMACDGCLRGEFRDKQGIEEGPVKLLRLTSGTSSSVNTGADRATREPPCDARRAAGAARQELRFCDCSRSAATTGLRRSRHRAERSGGGEES
jgi:hypothetical protein